MTFRERFVRRPQTTWLRKALFQAHLWSGIAFGLYVFAISITGSAIVFRNAIYQHFGAKPKIVAAGTARLSPKDLRAAIQRTYPLYHISYVWPNKNPNQAVEVWVERNGKYKQRLFDPFTGADVGPSVPMALRVTSWLGDLHFNLLAGEKGRAVNGYLAIVFTLMCLTGAIVWWPGIEHWRRSLAIHSGAGWKRFNWDLHSAIGFWTCAFSFMWGITGIYVVYQWPFQRLVGLFVVPDLFHPRQSLDNRILLWLTKLHFGNFYRGDWPLKTVWVLVGLAPALLFVTGVLMWWNRVLWPALRPARRKVEAPSAVLVE
ncbi:MAG: PepSY domain-containing protein [Acidobacteriia bacterium]|nr:PepSY domain-containing protein [Terriglobia bacterium]